MLSGVCAQRAETRSSRLGPLGQEGGAANSLDEADETEMIDELTEAKKPEEFVCRLECVRVRLGIKLRNILYNFKF